MTQEEKERYQPAETLKAILRDLKGRKFRLDCGHHVTIGHNLGNDITIRNGREPTVICSLCGY